MAAFELVVNAIGWTLIHSIWLGALAAAASDRGVQAGSHFHLAEIARDQGRRADAVAHAAACLALVPDHRAAAALLSAQTISP